MKTFKTSQLPPRPRLVQRSSLKTSLRSHLVERVLLSASRGRPLSARETEVLSGIIDRHSDKPLKLVSDYVSKSVRFGLVEDIERLFGPLDEEGWDLDFARVLEISAPSAIDTSLDKDFSTPRVPLAPDARISVSHFDQNVVLVAVDPDTGEPVDDYVSGDCGTFKIVQESGSHVRELYSKLFGSKES